jgi:hypothetical protein
MLFSQLPFFLSAFYRKTHFSMLFYFARNSFHTLPYGRLCCHHYGRVNERQNRMSKRARHLNHRLAACFARFHSCNAAAPAGVWT